MAKAPFLVLDGLDGTGKSTQCRLLADWLRGKAFSVVECVDPGSTAIGDVIRDLLLDRRREMPVACEAFLFMASRAQLTAEIIRPALEQGKAVVSDRYLLANIVYQGHAGGVDPDLLRHMGRLATGGIEPDLTLVLDLDPVTAASRRSGPLDRVESRDQDYQERVRAGFLAEARKQPERIRVVDAGRSVEAVHAHICREVQRILRR